MKQYYIIAALLLSALFASCSAEESAPVQKPAAPKFEFSIAGEAFSVEVDSSVVFTATRLEGTGVRTEWSVDGEKVAGTPSVTWKFTKLGVSNVHFEASNELGKVEKDYAVTVTGSPLEVSFSAESDKIEAVVGSQMEVSVTWHFLVQPDVEGWLVVVERIAGKPAITSDNFENDLSGVIFPENVSIDTQSVVGLGEDGLAGDFIVLHNARVC